MFCAQCGKEIPSGSPTCPACGAFAVPPGPARATRSPTVDEAVAQLKGAAKDLARSAQELSKRVAVEARKAADDPTGSAKRATRKVADELDNAARTIERVLRDL
jgi:cell division septum initiation protein DivIVA